MPIYNQHWYNINEGTAYPLDETATGESDANARLPNNIIADLTLRWPNTLGEFAFISSVSVTDHLVSVTIQAAEAVDSATTFAPLAVVSVAQPVVVGSQIALVGQADGVGGWIVFGAGVQENYRGRFSSPTQTLLTQRAARAYQPLPVNGARVLYAERSLTGIVALKATDPLTIGKEEREIDGVLRDCIVVRLTENADVTDLISLETPSTAKPDSIFREFMGPCGGRPESRTCGDPEPIEFINAVGPDCDGVLTLEFQGCATLAQIQDVCGIAVDCGFGLADACIPTQVPNSEGLLPGEYVPSNPTPEPSEPPPPVNDISESFVVVGEFPYIDCFADANPDDFIVKIGLWTIAEDASDPAKVCPDSAASSESTSNSSSAAAQYVYAVNSTSSRNVSVWQGFDQTTLHRKVSADVKLLEGPSGSKRNAAVVVNYRAHNSVTGLFVYYLAEIDYDTQQFRIARFNGNNFQTAVDVTLPGIQLNKWYKVTVTVMPGPDAGQTALTARLQSVEDTLIDATLGPLVVSNFLPSVGKFGFGSNRALCSFSYFEVEEA